MPAQGRTQHHVEEVLIPGMLAFAGTPIFIALECLGAIGDSRELQKEDRSCGKKKLTF
jgi:hypothetical protein